MKKGDWIVFMADIKGKAGPTLAFPLGSPFGHKDLETLKAFLDVHQTVHTSVNTIMPDGEE